MAKISIFDMFSVNHLEIKHRTQEHISWVRKARDLQILGITANRESSILSSIRDLTSSSNPRPPHLTHGRTSAYINMARIADGQINLSSWKSSASQEAFVLLHSCRHLQTKNHCIHAPDRTAGNANTSPHGIIEASSWLFADEKRQYDIYSFQV